MRLLLAPDKFKGSLTALAAAEAMQRGVLRAHPGAQTVLRPIADGGEGTAEALCAALGGEWITLRANDPLGREVEARYAWVEGDTAVIDMSEASGLWRLTPAEREPRRASTHGTGQLIAHAIARGARRILIGLGGSATNDGGIGMAEALGYRFLGSGGRPFAAIAANLGALSRIEPPRQPLNVEIIALCDVQNPLTGPRGASQMFGPQKGADPQTAAELDTALAYLADVAARDLGRDLGRDLRDTPGAGAAGGLGFGLLTFCGAKIQSGFETVAAILRLEQEIAASDYVLTGEGRLDVQTLEGKGPVGVAALARQQHKPVFAFAGAIENDPRLAELFEHAEAITPAGMPLEEALRRAPTLLEETVARAIASLTCGSKKE
ncbi:MAG: glycerate kinase [Chthoniobacteraceae bacterium]|nr:glycerate kinase [Chthoniobacteraceae bacterium]